MVSLAGIIGNNSIGYRHKFSKVNRAIYRSSFALLNKSIANRRVECVEFAPSQFIDVIWGTPDHERLNRCFDRIARGVYLSHFGQRFNGETHPCLGYLRSSDPNQREFHRFIRAKVAAELEGKPQMGSNQQVFSFQFTDRDHSGASLVRFLFYGGLEVYVSLVPDKVRIHENLAMKLIALGLPTTIGLGSQLFRFNIAPDDLRQSGKGVAD